MLKKPCRVIKEENNELKIYGNGHLIEIEYQDSEYEEGAPCFKYKGQYHFLSEFMRTSGNSWLSEYDGYRGDSYFSGLLIKLCESNDAVKVYTYTN